MYYQSKYRNTQQELFSLQTQIRAELNTLRKTYGQKQSESQKHIERKHFPEMNKKNTNFS